MNTEDKARILKELFPGSRAHGLKTRGKIIAAFMRSLVSNGFENITFESLGRTTKLSKAHVYHFFKSIDDLLFHCIEYIAAGGHLVSQRKVAEASKPVDKLLAVSDAAFDWYSAHPEYLSVLILALYKAAFDRRYQDRLQLIRQRGIEHIASLLPTSPNRGLQMNLATEIQTTIIGQLIVGSTSGPGGFDTFRQTSRNMVRLLASSGEVLKDN